MIHFKLTCPTHHEFEGWFRNNDDFETQQKQGLLLCPTCGSDKVEKMLMTPAIAGSKKRVGLGLDENQRKLLDTMRQLTRQVRKNADYVGEKFPEEARKIHFGEVDARAIYGEASGEELKSLWEDGVSVIPLPELPEDKN